MNRKFRVKRVVSRLPGGIGSGLPIKKRKTNINLQSTVQNSTFGVPCSVFNKTNDDQGTLLPATSKDF
ncbi:MAG: hypothetical protein A2W91_11065 [Bacteroidetes bacterium GWF2_38_335]|nr:MAG: hypothetical protein A2W91_11065 [Bacteroidetes bacterium GWF2_38_335]OFY81760.1 MAG: hypothetical protein A2281_05975 [Bacteroidetes bacterium RIFOXYA12_FULL_38_20]HBS87828.1 hypothetical protein [Bacteroidales bacterium]